MKKLFFLLVMLIWLIVYSCKKDNNTNTSNTCLNNPQSFSMSVNPIIQGSCATDVNCHGTGSTEGSGELKTYWQIYTWRATIRADVASGRMPLQGTLDSLSKLAILCWINSGAPDN